MKKIIAFSLWGSNPKYNIGAIENAKIRHEIYGDDWTCSFYVSKSVPIDTIDSLSQIDNTEIIKMDEEGDWSGMFWRFLPAFDDSVSVFVSRDTDSRLSLREKYAVQEWLDSDKDFHIMRDHPFHNTAILGGMWGCRNNLLNKLGIKLKIPDNHNFWQVDQNFLREHVYPKIKEYAFIHDQYSLMGEIDSKIFPTERTNQQFVGEIYDEHNHRHSDHYRLL